MARNPCSCCQWLAHCIPNILYAILHALFNIGLIGLGVYLLMHAINCFHSSVAPLISKEIYGGCIGVGGALAIVGIFGLLGPYACRMEKEDAIKTHYILSLLVLLVCAAFTVVAFLTANDKANLHNMLDYGWARSAGDPSHKQDDLSIELAYKCCGFSGKADRPVAPCPSNAQGSCEAPLTSALKTQFSFAGLLFGAGAGGLLLLMCIGHGFVEKLSFLKRKDASLDGADVHDRKGFTPAETKKRRTEKAIPRPLVAGFGASYAAGEGEGAAADGEVADGHDSYPVAAGGGAGGGAAGGGDEEEGVDRRKKGGKRTAKAR